MAQPDIYAGIADEPKDIYAGIVTPAKSVQAAPKDIYAGITDTAKTSAQARGEYTPPQPVSKAPNVPNVPLAQNPLLRDNVPDAAHVATGKMPLNLPALPKISVPAITQDARANQQYAQDQAQTLRLKKNAEALARAKQNPATNPNYDQYGNSGSNPDWRTSKPDMTSQALGMLQKGVGHVLTPPATLAALNPTDRAEIGTRMGAAAGVPVQLAAGAPILAYQIAQPIYDSIRTGTSKPLDDALQSMADSLNPFGEGLSPYQRAMNSINLGLTLLGAAHGIGALKSRLGSGMANLHTEMNGLLREDPEIRALAQAHGINPDQVASFVDPKEATSTAASAVKTAAGSVDHKHQGEPDVAPILTQPHASEPVVQAAEAPVETPTETPKTTGAKNSVTETATAGNAPAEIPNPPIQAETPNAAQVPPTEIPKPVAPDGNTMGLSNAAQAPKVEGGLFNEPEKGARPSKADIHAQGVGTSIPDARSLAADVAAGRIPFSSSNVAKLMEGGRQFENAVNTAAKDLTAARATGDQGLIDAKQEEFNNLRSQHQEFVDNVQKGKTEWHNTGRALQNRLELDTGNLAQVSAEYRRVSGKEIPEHVQKLIDQVADTQRQLDEANAKLAKSEADRVVRNVQRQARSQARAGTKEALAAERADIGKQLAQLGSRLSANPIDLAPEAVKLIGKLAKNVIQDGATSLAEVVDRVNTHLQEWGHEKLTDRQIHDALSGYGQTGQSSTRSEAGMRLSEMQRLARLTSQMNDAITGLESPSGPRKSVSDTVAGMRKALAEVKKIQGLRGAGETDPGVRIAKAYEKALEILEHGPEEKRSPKPDTPETAAARAKLAEVRKQIADRHGESAEAKKVKTLESQLKDAQTKAAQGPGPKEHTVPTEQVANLQAALKQARKEFSDKWGTPQETQRINQLEASIARQADKLQNGSPAPKPEPMGPETAAVSALRRKLEEAKAQVKAKYGNGPVPRSEQARLDALQKTLDAKTAQLQKGFRPLKKARAVDTETIKLTKAKIADTNRQLNLSDHIEELKRQLRENDFPGKKEANPASKEVERLKRQRDALGAKVKASIEAAKPKTPLDHLTNGVLGWERAGLISSPTTTAKVGISNLATGAAAHAEELLGPIVKHLPGAGGAGSETRFNPHAEAAALRAAFSGKNFAEGIRKALTGFDRLDNEAIAHGIHKAEQPSIITRLATSSHVIAANPTRYAAFERQWVKSLSEAARKGGNVNDPNVRLAAFGESYAAAQRATLMNDSMASSALTSFLKFTSKEKFGGVGKAVSFGLQSVAPIAHIPINALGRSMEYQAGIPYALTKAALEKMNGTKLSPEASQAIARAYKRGGVGLGLAVLGGSVHAFQIDKKTNDLTFNGKSLGMAQHIPWLQALKMGVMIRSASGNAFQRLATGVGGSAMQTAGRLPGIDMAAQMVEAGRAKGGADNAGAAAGRVAGAYAKTLAEPVWMQQLAKMYDPKPSSKNAPGFSGQFSHEARALHRLFGHRG